VLEQRNVEERQRMEQTNRSALAAAQTERSTTICQIYEAQALEGTKNERALADQKSKHNQELAALQQERDEAVATRGAASGLIARLQADMTGTRTCKPPAMPPSQI